MALWSVAFLGSTPIGGPAHRLGHRPCRGEGRPRGRRRLLLRGGGRGLLAIRHLHARDLARRDGRGQAGSTGQAGAPTGIRPTGLIGPGYRVVAGTRLPAGRRRQTPLHHSRRPSDSHTADTGHGTADGPRPMPVGDRSGRPGPGAGGGRRHGWSRRRGRRSPRAGGCGEGHHPVGRGGSQQPVPDARRREVVGRRADGGLLPHRPRGRVEAVEGAVLADGPHQAGGHDRRAAPVPELHSSPEGVRAAPTRTATIPLRQGRIDHLAHLGTAPVHVVADRPSAMTPAGHRCPRGGSRPAGRRYRALPAITTCPSASRAGAMDRSRSAALSDAHDDGAKYCTRCSAGSSSRTESLSS